MTITKIKGSRVKITGEHGIKDSRTGMVYSEIVCKSSEVSRFTDVPEETEEEEQ